MNRLMLTAAALALLANGAWAQAKNEGAKAEADSKRKAATVVGVCPAEDGESEDACPNLEAAKRAAAAIDEKGEVKLKKGEKAAYDNEIKKLVAPAEQAKCLGGGPESKCGRLAEETHMLIMTKRKVKAKLKKAKGKDRDTLSKANVKLKKKLKEASENISKEKLDKELAPAKAAAEKEAAAAEAADSAAGAPAAAPSEGGAHQHQDHNQHKNH